MAQIDNDLFELLYSQGEYDKCMQLNPRKLMRRIVVNGDAAKYADYYVPRDADNKIGIGIANNMRRIIKYIVASLGHEKTRAVYSNMVCDGCPARSTKRVEACTDHEALLDHRAPSLYMPTHRAYQCIAEMHDTYCELKEYNPMTDVPTIEEWCSSPVEHSKRLLSINKAGIFAKLVDASHPQVVASLLQYCAGIKCYYYEVCDNCVVQYYSKCEGKPQSYNDVVTIETAANCLVKMYKHNNK